MARATVFFDAAQCGRHGNGTEHAVPRRWECYVSKVEARGEGLGPKVFHGRVRIGKLIAHFVDGLLPDLILHDIGVGCRAERS